MLFLGVKEVKYFSKFEITLFIVSMLSVIISFLIFDRENYMILVASLFGVGALIFAAKANPIGPSLILVFCVLYGIISLTYSYYGEMITYLGMTAPMAVVSIISWVRNPYNGNKAEVTVNHIKRKEIILVFILTAAITFAFWFILDYLGTANMVPSTISVATSFLAAYFTFRRSELFALAYAANDIVLVILWSMASMTDITYVSMTVCFAIFFINDVYTFLNWIRIKNRQTA